MSSELDCCIVTFNCARELVDPDLLAGHLHAALSATNDPPDLLVLALEELAPIAYSLIGGSYLSQYILRFVQSVDTLVKLWSGPEAIRYEMVTSSTAGMTGLLVFAQPDVARNIVQIDTAAVRVGNYELGNKGAVAARLHYRKGGDSSVTQLTFVGAHLAPMEERCERRNLDWRTISENMLFRPDSRRTSKSQSNTRNEATEESEPLLPSQPVSHPYHGLYSPNSYLFVAGDLNYRTADFGPSKGAAQHWPDVNETTDSATTFASLWATDQLTRELREGRTLHHLQETEVRFAPTYKYSAAAQRQAAGIQSPDSQPSNPWAAHRVPSWCDRVLYYSPGTHPRITLYDSLPLLPSSDHRAVLLRAGVSLDHAVHNGATDRPMSPPFDLNSDAAARATRSRMKDIVVGVLALVVTTWEGRLLLLGTLAGAVGGWAILRSLL